MKLRLWKTNKALQFAFAPANIKCLSCGVDVFDQTAFCPHCLKNVQFNNGKTCKRCGVAIRGAEDYCGHCAFEKTYYDRAYSPLLYSGAVQKAILTMKFGHIATHAQSLANYLVFEAHKQNLQFDIVTFVPMTKSAQKQRGYNQSQLLAQHFCDILDIAPPVETLQKVKETQRQEQLGKEQRKENLVGAFEVVADVKGKTVLVIDDIKTTGSTLNECAKVLKRKGATQVLGLTVASREENYRWEIGEEYENFA